MLSPAWALPRLGLHEGFTRLVFDLPENATYAVALDKQTVVLTFRGVSEKPDDVSVGSPEVASYQVVPGQDALVVYVRLKPGAEPRWQLYDDAQGRRLVLDVFSPPSPKPASTPPPKPGGNVDSPAPKPQPKVVVIDPGHGGFDPGMVGVVVEKQITLAVALRLREILQARGIQVIMTREQDEHLSRDKATDLSMRADMANSKRNLFVSIHVNANGKGTAQGVETYVFGKTVDNSLLDKVIQENGGGEIGKRLTRQAESLAESLVSDIFAQFNLKYSKQLATFVQQSLVRATGALDRSVYSASLHVLRNARIPAILVEIGFGDHKIEGAKLADPKYQDRVATALADAIEKFLSNGKTASK